MAGEIAEIRTVLETSQRMSDPDNGTPGYLVSVYTMAHVNRLLDQIADERQDMYLLRDSVEQQAQMWLESSPIQCTDSRMLTPVSMMALRDTFQALASLARRARRDDGALGSGVRHPRQWS